VQSVALILVVEREKEIEAFNPVEYWNIAAWLQPEESKGIEPFRAQLHTIDGKKVVKEAEEGKEDKVALVATEAAAQTVVDDLNSASCLVTRVEKKEKKRHPVPSFITSTLQQEASRYYSFSSTRTMSIAQSLYEGIDMGTEGREGLITYMRTDSVRVAPEALTAAR
jgi:DNA topoisomerase-1